MNMNSTYSSSSSPPPPPPLAPLPPAADSLDFANELYYALYRFDRYYKAFIVIVGLIGNGMTIVIFARSKIINQSHRTSFYLISLAVSDICFLLSLLVTLLDDFDLWKLYRTNSYVCKLTAYTQFVFTFVSCALVLMFTAQRLCSVCFPLRINLLNQKRSKTILICLFIFGLLFYSVNLYLYDVNSGDCISPGGREVYAEIFNCIDSVFTFLIPFFGMVIMNTMMIKTLKKSTFNFILKTSSNRHFPCEPLVNINNNNTTSFINKTINNNNNNNSNNNSNNNNNNNNNNNKNNNNNNKMNNHGKSKSDSNGRSNDSSLHLNRMQQHGTQAAAANSGFNLEANLNANGASTRLIRSCSHNRKLDKKKSHKKLLCFCWQYLNKNSRNNCRNEEDEGVEEEEFCETRHSFRYSDRVIEEDEDQTAAHDKEKANANVSLSLNKSKEARFAFNKQKQSITKYKCNSRLQFDDNLEKESANNNINNNNNKNKKENKCKCKFKCFKCIFVRPTSYDSMFFKPLSTASRHQSNMKSNASSKRRNTSFNPNSPMSKRNRSFSLHNRLSFKLNNRAMQNTNDNNKNRFNSFRMFKRQNGELKEQRHGLGFRTKRHSSMKNSFSSLPKRLNSDCASVLSSGALASSAACRANSMRISNAKTNTVSKRVTKMLIFVSSVFLLLNLPIHTLNVYACIKLLLSYSYSFKNANNYATNSNNTTTTLLMELEGHKYTINETNARLLATILFYTSFSCNFLLYSISGVTFRTELKRLFLRLFKVGSHV